MLFFAKLSVILNPLFTNLSLPHLLEIPFLSNIKLSHPLWPISELSAYFSVSFLTTPSSLSTLNSKLWSCLIDLPSQTGPSLLCLPHIFPLFGMTSLLPFSWQMSTLPQLTSPGEPPMAIP